MSQSCAHAVLHSSIDRWDECHWHVHEIERHYHEPALFRFSFNGFLRAIKEIPQVLKMEIQPLSNSARLRAAIDGLNADPLFATLKKKRDFLVHQGSLDLKSIGKIGVTEGRGWKMARPFPVHPFESSQQAYERFKELCRSNRDVRALFGPDGDSWPMLWREWRLAEFDADLLEIAVNASTAAGTLIAKLSYELGVAVVPTLLDCRHDPDQVKYVSFSQRDFFREVDGIDLDDPSSMNVKKPAN